MCTTTPAHLHLFDVVAEFFKTFDLLETMNCLGDILKTLTEIWLLGKQTQSKNILHLGRIPFTHRHSHPETAEEVFPLCYVM